MKKFFTTRVRVVLVLAVLAALITVGSMFLWPGKAGVLNNAVSIVVNPVKNGVTLLVNIGFVDRIICKRLLLRSGERTQFVAVFVEKSERAVYVFFGVEANGIRARAVCGVEVCRDS